MFNKEELTILNKTLKYIYIYTTYIMNTNSTHIAGARFQGSIIVSPHEYLVFKVSNSTPINNSLIVFKLVQSLRVRSISCNKT